MNNNIPMNKQSAKIAKANQAMRKTTYLHNIQRKEICLYHDECKAKNIKMTQDGLGKWAQQRWNLPEPISQGNISKILREKAKYLSMKEEGSLLVKSNKSLKYPHLDKAIADFVLRMQEQNVPVSGPAIIDEARRLARTFNVDATSLNFSNGWFRAFKSRWNLSAHEIFGESGSIPLTDAQIEEELKIIRSKIEGLNLNDVYNFDETGLYYSLAPRNTISQRPIVGFKDDKTRITLGLMCNATGTHKFEQLIIGHFRKPRSFLNKDAIHYGFCHYYYNKKAWMTKDIFEDYFMSINSRLRSTGRQILVLLDNASSHKCVKLSNVQFLFLPPNTTSKLQPLDQGIIYNLKANYRTTQYKNAAIKSNINKQYLEQGHDEPRFQFDKIFKMSQLDAMRVVKSAWGKVSVDTIANCWYHSRIVSRPFVSVSEQSGSSLPGTILSGTANVQVRSELMQLFPASSYADFSIQELVNGDRSGENEEILDEEEINEELGEVTEEVPVEIEVDCVEEDFTVLDGSVNNDPNNNDDNIVDDLVKMRDAFLTIQALNVCISEEDFNLSQMIQKRLQEINAMLKPAQNTMKQGSMLDYFEKSFD